MLTTTDLAKYPFTIEASEYVKSLKIGVSELASGGYDRVLERAEQRIRESEKDAMISPAWQDTDVEVLSFPTAIMFVSQMANQRIARRYALSESKRAYEHMRNETPEKVLHMAKNTFSWKITPAKNVESGFNSNCGLHFTDYLRNAKNIRDARWKLTNRIFYRGFVTVTWDETARLLEEEVQRKVLSRIRSPMTALPESLAERVRRLKEEAGTPEPSYVEVPKMVVAHAMPPCIRALNQALASGKHLSHLGRFTLTSFLLSIGLNVEDLVKMFKETSDFDERMTRYQVEHIGGLKGVRTRYSPPKCDTLKTHGLCVNPNELCRLVKHPLFYYKRRVYNRRVRSSGS